MDLRGEEMDLVEIAGRGVAKFQRETRFGISKFSGAKIMASDGIPPRGRMELSENF